MSENPKGELLKRGWAWIRKTWEFILISILVALVASAAVGGCRSNVAFLNDLNTATVELLGFTGIILTIAFAAYYSARTALDSDSRGWFDVGTKPVPSDADPKKVQELEKIQELALKWQNHLKKEAEEMPSRFRLCFGAFFLSASVFAVLTAIEIFDLKTQSLLWGCLNIINHMFFFAEFFLLVYGIEMLVFGFYALSRAAREVTLDS